MIADKVAFIDAKLLVLTSRSGRCCGSAARMGLTDLTETALHAAADAVGGDDVPSVIGNVTQPQDCERAVAQAIQRFGGRPLCDISP